jgi:anhydro-N-acetylmuramic acid kinase
MSGTSLDGIDVAIVDLRGQGIETVGGCSVAYPKKLRETLLAISNCVTHTAAIARMNFLLAELYASAFFGGCEALKIAPETVELIGCHGQTIYHDEVCTLQIGDGSVLAERTGVPVVSDFRPRDMAAGGRGAPLVPFVDYRLFRNAKRGRVAVNIGGIANLTYIPAGAKPEQVAAFDTGPGNMVIDQLVSHFTKERRSYDRGGKMAAKGQVDPGLLAELLSAPYYKEKPPKTAGREQYGTEFVAALLACKLKPEDLVATATALTAAAIAEGIYRFEGVDDVIVSGGGVHNETLMRYLRAELPEMSVASSAEYGIDPDAKEAIAFAILAHETWRGRPSNLPSATGARGPVILGKISPGMSLGKSDRRR